eukprot:scaffold698_cov195-Skeletonema_marinoi.AAC.8
MMSESLIVAVLNGYARELFDSDMDNKTALKTLRLLVDNRIYTYDEILYAMKLLLDKEIYSIEWTACVVDLLQNVMDALGLQPIFYTKQVQEICTKVIGEVIRATTGNDKDAAAVKFILGFFEKLAFGGVDIQQIGKDDVLFSSISDQGDFKKGFIHLQQKQLSDWSRFDIVKKGGSLADVQRFMKDGSLTIDSRDQGGILLTHLCAAYDRVDLLEWLVSEGMDLNALDAQRRTTLDVAKASKASLATKWIVEWKAKTIIGSFLRRSYYHTMHRRRLLQSNDAATLIQSVIRAYATRKIFANVLVRRLEESQHFASVWGRAIASLTMSHLQLVGLILESN